MLNMCNNTYLVENSIRLLINTYNKGMLPGKNSKPAEHFQSLPFASIYLR